MFLIADDEDTLIGMRLCGIKGITVKKDEIFKSEFTRAANNSEIGILLISESFVKGNEMMIDNIRLNKSLPLIVEIPGRNGSSKSSDYITDYIKAAIGVKL